MKKNITFSGDLKFISLADVFQILGGNAGTGVLELKNTYSPHEGIIYFSKGNPINASFGRIKGLNAIYRLFGWEDGTYTFVEEEIPGISHLIKKSRMEIVLDALRLLDDGEIERTGPLSLNPGIGRQKRDEKEKAHLPALKGPLNDYLHVVREDCYKDGEEIVREGTHGKWIWTIYEGHVKVTKKTEDGPVLVARLGEGCLIGTIRALLFGNYERNATVTAEGDVRLCLLDAEPYYYEYASLSREFRQLLISLDGRLRRLNERAMDIYLKRGSVVQPVKSRGKAGNFKPDRELYKIIRGNAAIITRGQKGDFPILSLGQNDLFGNVPFLNIGHEGRNATVLPSDDIMVEKMNIQSLEEEYKGLSNTFKDLIFNIGSYITMTTDLIRQYE